MTYDSLGEAEEALSFYQRALNIWEKFYGEEHPNIATNLSNIGRVYYRLGNAKKALFYYQKALTIREKIYGGKHPLVIENRKNVIAVIYRTIEHPQKKIAFILAEYNRREVDLV